jgi:hypothetical protein
LKALVEQQEKESATAVALYTPKTTGRLDDLTVPAELLLRQLPGVVNIEVAVRADASFPAARRCFPSPLRCSGHWFLNLSWLGLQCYGHWLLCALVAIICPEPVNLFDAVDQPTLLIRCRDVP